MGLTNAVHWLAWFITSIIMMMVTTVILVFVLKFGYILRYSDPFLVFIFLSVFTISTIMFCFLVSVFFSRANVAAACGGLIYLTTYLPYIMLTIFEDHVSKSHLVAGVSTVHFSSNNTVSIIAIFNDVHTIFRNSVVFPSIL